MRAKNFQPGRREPDTNKTEAEVKARGGDDGGAFFETGAPVKASTHVRQVDCWFCGRWTKLLPVYRGEVQFWNVVCNHCRASGPIKATSAEAIAAWNKVRQAEIMPEIRISDGVQVCLSCGCVFAEIDDDSTCADCRETEGDQ